MKVNSNKKIHKLKRDPYRLLLKMTLVLAIAIVVGIAVFYLCTVIVTNRYSDMRVELERSNIEAEMEFNANMAALRIANAPSVGAAPERQGNLGVWEKELDSDLWRIEEEASKRLENTSNIIVDRHNAMLGGLFLVNAWHPLPADFNDAELVSIGTATNFKIPVQDNSVRLFPVALDALNAMYDDALEAGMQEYIVREGYRSNDTQTELFNNAMERLSRDYSGDILIAETKKSVNYPGTSEFQTGLAFRMHLYSRSDPEVARQNFQQTEQGKWFTENAWKYGVAFRFPTKDFPTPEWEDKSYKTGVSIELNLYRYVGKAHAVAMRIMNFCLEEYIEFLIDHPHISIYQNGNLRYEIFRMELEGYMPSYEVPLPNPASDYQASLDNMGGMVMAYTY